jgi:hypothetical protein
MGTLDVDAMLQRMTASQLAEWEAFSLLEPFGSSAEDHRFGVVASTVANFAGKSVRPGREVKPSDLFPSRIPKPKPDIRAQIHAVFGPLAGRGVADGRPR